MNDLARDIRCLFGREKDRHSCDILWSARPADQRPCDQLLATLGSHTLSKKLGVRDISRGNGIDGDSLRPEDLSEGNLGAE